MTTATFTKLPALTLCYGFFLSFFFLLFSLFISAHLLDFSLPENVSVIANFRKSC